MRYVCIVCGYIYDPAHGDPVAGIPPGTAFEDLPDSWVCPECAASKEMFEPVKEGE
ncbi:MAG: rubredoxin [Myxococcota bacterium]|jgi:rubredoxin|nr:rubredoxin [Myxococcota bacterium]OQC35042.1 MAG: Rubredoxin [Deltaproteobacteria bacterium ADurb.Bin058]HHW96828.1 rubredoxin [Oligoflexales bacterium]MBP8970338.1 rubredoxin [Myxococcota bacterium]HOE81349.1 rubredoxin [Myxococcota bacterium]